MNIKLQAVAILLPQYFPWCLQPRCVLERKPTGEGFLYGDYEDFVRLAGVDALASETIFWIRIWTRANVFFWSIQTYGSNIIAQYLINRSQPHSVSDTRNYFFFGGGGRNQLDALVIYCRLFIMRSFGYFSYWKLERVALVARSSRMRARELRSGIRS
jgi:hypothetical protein